MPIPVFHSKLVPFIGDCVCQSSLVTQHNWYVVSLVGRTPGLDHPFPISPSENFSYYVSMPEKIFHEKSADGCGKAQRNYVYQVLVLLPTLWSESHLSWIGIHLMADDVPGIKRLIPSEWKEAELKKLPLHSYYNDDALIHDLLGFVQNKSLI
ncbi:hypothetical protein VNO77_18478 [Canavalia gladiata]|uniref:Uncharacterized protein n=1 Tax=Canavalia gladiata TaxID=3824 RepID=A0AAN9LKW6_CANGL